MDAGHPGPQLLAHAASVIRRGGLVAFPTETVYGLGANALDAAAVARIFAAKGRPSFNPLIVHVPGVEEARELVTDWPDAAERLARAFWPGPLTLVLGKRDVVPDIVTAGLPNVGVRVPSHPIALALLRGRDYMLPVDVRDLARDVLRHRIVLTYEALAAGVDADRVLDDVLERVPMPRIELAQERPYGA